MQCDICRETCDKELCDECAERAKGWDYEAYKRGFQVTLDEEEE